MEDGIHAPGKGCGEGRAVRGRQGVPAHRARPSEPRVSPGNPAVGREHSRGSHGSPERPPPPHSPQPQPGRRQGEILKTVSSSRPDMRPVRSTGSVLDLPGLCCSSVQRILQRSVKEVEKCNGTELKKLSRGFCWVYF